MAECSGKRNEAQPLRLARDQEAVDLQPDLASPTIAGNTGKSCRSEETSMSQEQRRQKIGSEK
jgi:hypothetical protein